MFALCHNLVYACQAERPFVQDYAACDYKAHVEGHGCADTNWAAEHYRQVNATLCADEQLRSPQYDHCGLYLYGPYHGPKTASHLQGEGEHFELNEFWANPVSRVTGERLAYIKQTEIDSFLSRLQNVLVG